MITLLLVGAALAFLLWPRGKPLSALLPAAVEAVTPVPTLPAPPAPLPAPDGRAAIDSLLAVRDRLAAAGPMDAESAKAVDKLWLDLLHTGAQK